ncbi:hypothetical protein FRB90_007228, partial [Tulasnella sp. 427]
MSLDRYISDNAIKFFGLSDNNIVTYVKAAASSAKSPEALFHALTSQGLPNTPEARNFVTEVYAQAPRKHKAKKHTDAPKVESNKDLLAKKFSLLLDNDAGDAEVRSKSKGKSKASGSSEKDREKERSSKRDRKERHTRKRETDGNAWESDEEEKANKRRRTEEPEDYPQRDERSHSPVDEEPAELMEDEATRKE